MTAHQTAIAAAADLKWLTNSAALLRRRLRHTPDEARWWGLVRLLVTDVGMSLRAAAAAASVALRSLPADTNRKQARRPQPATAKQDPTGAAAVVVDLTRYQSTTTAAAPVGSCLAVAGRAREIGRG